MTAKDSLQFECLYPGKGAGPLVLRENK